MLSNYILLEIIKKYQDNNLDIYKFYKDSNDPKIKYKITTLKKDNLLDELLEYFNEYFESNLYKIMKHDGYYQISLGENCLFIKN